MLACAAGRVTLADEFHFFGKLIVLDHGHGVNSLYAHLSEISVREGESIAKSQRIGAIGMTEPGAGSDLAGIRTTAVRDGDFYVVNGSKTFISNGQHADVVIMAVKTDVAADARWSTASLPFAADSLARGQTAPTFDEDAPARPQAAQDLS